MAAHPAPPVFGLSMFGFDAVVLSGTHEIMVIDVNYFPSYKELRSELPALLTAYFTSEIVGRAGACSPCN